MTMATKQAILNDKLTEYLHASRQKKGDLLNQMEAVTTLHRKAIIRRFKQLQMSRVPVVERRGRPEVYDPRVTVALKELWELASEICAERLHPMIPEYVRILKRDKLWRYNAQTTELLLQMSVGTMKGRLSRLRRSRGHRGKSATKPASLKEIIPIRRGPWDNPPPGFGEIDTVAHCGSSLLGDFAYTVQYTDVTTIWTCLSAQWNKGQKATVRSIERIKQRLPFRLKGLDPDSGSEFINWLVKGWCDEQEPPVVMTRSRPYRKNDHARIEQKNYVNVRRFLGYTRIDAPKRVVLMNTLYDYLEDYINFFLPSVKCLKKERMGNHYKRVYDVPQTAYQRVLTCTTLTQEVTDALRAKYATLNPQVLKQQIDTLIMQILTNTHY